MNFLVTGATGFIGRRLVERLRAGPHTVHAFGRQMPDPLPAADAVIHLAGEPVGQLWTPWAKRRIRASRVEGTRRLVEMLAASPRRPSVLVCASAVGIYGSRGGTVLTEQSAPGEGFLAEVCVNWEWEALRAKTFGVRVVCARIGMVLGPGGGALARMLPVFNRGWGGTLGSGTQWVSWIHIDDLVNLLLFAAGNGLLCGSLNATSPRPVTNAEFTARLAAALERPAKRRVPALALRMLLGQMSGILLDSQRVMPVAAQAAGFAFAHSDLAAALRDALPARVAEASPVL